MDLFILERKMGGAAGHLSHVFEDRSLTFSDIKNILTRTSLGSLSHVSEKLDGLNMVISWNSNSDSLVFSRSLSDIKSGGMDSSALEFKFRNRGTIAEAFNEAYAILTKAFSAIDKQSKIDIFGVNANIWYSIEIIFRKNKNVLLYDSDAVVFHEHPMFFKYGNDLSVKTKHFLFQILLENLPFLSSKVEESSNWKILGPKSIRMPEMSDKTPVYEALDFVNSMRDEFELSDSSTIEDYLSRFLKMKIDNNHEMIDCLQFSNMIIDRCLERKGVTLTQLKKLTTKDVYSKISGFVSESVFLLRNAIEPLEKTMADFSNLILSSIESRLISNSNAEINRIREELNFCIDEIIHSNNLTWNEALQKNLNKIGEIEKIQSCVEGIVFEYKEKFYKLTGKFASINQIMGIKRYGNLNES